jgi:hypothetical protein
MIAVLFGGGVIVAVPSLSAVATLGGCVPSFAVSFVLRGAATCCKGAATCCKGAAVL